MPKCPRCNKKVKQLSTRKSSLIRLFTCTNKKCAGENQIYNDKNGNLEIGSAGLY